MPEITNDQVRNQTEELIRAGKTIDQVELADDMRKLVIKLLIRTLGINPLDKLEGSWRQLDGKGRLLHVVPHDLYTGR